MLHLIVHMVRHRHWQHMYLLILMQTLSTMGASPNGLNINDGVGSTHPEELAKLVVEKGANIGLAFDGDGIVLSLLMNMEKLLMVTKLCSLSAVISFGRPFEIRHDCFDNYE